MVLEKGFLALSAGTRRPNEGDFGTGANEIKGRNDGDVVNLDVADRQPTARRYKK
jgi:hypothetical protein